MGLDSSEASPFRPRGNDPAEPGILEDVKLAGAWFSYARPHRQGQPPEMIGVAGFIAHGGNAHPAARAGDLLRLPQIIPRVAIQLDVQLN